MGNQQQQQMEVQTSGELPPPGYVCKRCRRPRHHFVRDCPTNVCNKCGILASVNHEKHIHVCNMCSNMTDFSFVQIPYACKLLFHELMTMNIAPRVITEHV